MFEDQDKNKEPKSRTVLYKSPYNSCLINAFCWLLAYEIYTESTNADDFGRLINDAILPYVASMTLCLVSAVPYLSKRGTTKCAYSDIANLPMIGIKFCDISWQICGGERFIKHWTIRPVSWAITNFWYVSPPRNILCSSRHNSSLFGVALHFNFS